MQTQTIAGHYGQDHQRLDELFHRFQELQKNDFAEAARLFAEFKAGLERHIVWEEEILFPRFDASFGHLSGSPTAIMRWEHQHLRRYLARIEQNLARHDTETELEQIAFLSLLCSHNQKEESVLYPMMDELFGEEERSSVFAEMGRTH
ncbi:MAG: hemerythrin domain-containing protein [Chloroflexi bacterium]|nr:hemerythrin domain-containing protein [Chloroflexota bacterium]